VARFKKMFVKFCHWKNRATLLKKSLARLCPESYECGTLHVST